MSSRPWGGQCRNVAGRASGPAAVGARRYPQGLVRAQRRPGQAPPLPGHLRVGRPPFLTSGSDPARLGGSQPMKAKRSKLKLDSGWPTFPAEYPVTLLL